MNKLKLLIVILAVSNFTFSQSSLTEQEVIEYTVLSQELEGTYQIQMIDTRALPSIELSLFPRIRDARDANSIIYLTISGNMRVMILPQSTIEQVNFVPVEKVTHVNSSNL